MGINRQNRVKLERNTEAAVGFLRIFANAQDFYHKMLPTHFYDVFSEESIQVLSEMEIRNFFNSYFGNRTTEEIDKLFEDYIGALEHTNVNQEDLAKALKVLKTPAQKAMFLSEMRTINSKAFAVDALRNGRTEKIVFINQDNIDSEDEFIETLIHEMGHILERRLTDVQKQELNLIYERFKEELPPKQRKNSTEFLADSLENIYFKKNNGHKLSALEELVEDFVLSLD